MFAPKNYVCCCHGCGRIHVLVSPFMSSPLLVAVTYPDDPQPVALPAHGCPECMALPKGDDHPIRRAFAHGMTSEARARACEEWEAGAAAFRELSKALPKAS